MVRSSEAAAGLEQLVATTVAHEAAAGTLTVETLRRYLSAAEEDREAATERAAEAAVRSRRLIVAIVGLGLVVGATNVALAVRRPNVIQTYNVAPARLAEAPAAVTVPAAPPQAPPVSAEASQLASVLPPATAPTSGPVREAKKDQADTVARPRLTPAPTTAPVPRPARVRAVVFPKEEERGEGGDSAAERTVAERW